MKNPRRASLTWLISLISLMAIPLLLWACGGPAVTPTPTLTMDPQPITLPTVESNHPHDVVLTTCPVEEKCMGHMYLTRATLAEGFTATTDLRMEIYTVLHDHPGLNRPDLTGSTIALVDTQPVAKGTPTPASRTVDVYLDPTWDFQLDPAELRNTLACNITDTEAQAKLDRVISDLVPRLKVLPTHVPTDNIWRPIDVGNPLGIPRPTRVIDTRSLLPATPTTTTAEILAVDTQEVRCIVVAEDRNDHRLILAVQGLEIAKGGVLSTVVAVQTATATPSP